MTKKLENPEDLSFGSLRETLPSIHILTQNVIINKSPCGNYYLTGSVSADNESNSLGHLMKLKKIIAKQMFESKQVLESKSNENKLKMTDDVIWVKPSPLLYYQREGMMIPCNRVLLDYPVKLQLSLSQWKNVYSLGKPYQSCNLFWTIDFCIVDKDFDIELLNIAGDT